MPTPSTTTNGTGPHTTAATPIKSSAAKSRGALKRLKAKAKAGGGGGKGSNRISETPTETESEAEVCWFVSGNYITTELTKDGCQSTTSTVDLSTLEIDPSDPRLAAFSNIFAHFQGGEGDETAEQFAGPAKGEVYYSDEEDDDQEAKENAVKRAQEQEGLTRRQRRQAAVSFVIQCSHFYVTDLGAVCVEIDRGRAEATRR